MVNQAIRDHPQESHSEPILKASEAIKLDVKLFNLKHGLTGQ
jgi:hypothetical protein